MGDGSATREFIELTVHEPERLGRPVDDPRVVTSYAPMRPELKPPPLKAYPDIAARPVPEHLSDLLHWSAGIVRIRRQTPLGTQLFRAAGSAGNLHPLEVYVVNDGEISAYQPLEHRLLPLGTGLPAGPTTLVITGVPWRTAFSPSPTALHDQGASPSFVGMARAPP